MRNALSCEKPWCFSTDCVCTGYASYRKSRGEKIIYFIKIMLFSGKSTTPTPNEHTTPNKLDSISMVQVQQQRESAYTMADKVARHAHRLHGRISRATTDPMRGSFRNMMEIFSRFCASEASLWLPAKFEFLQFFFYTEREVDQNGIFSTATQRVASRDLVWCTLIDIQRKNINAIYLLLFFLHIFLSK